MGTGERSASAVPSSSQRSVHAQALCSNRQSMGVASCLAATHSLHPLCLQWSLSNSWEMAAVTASWASLPFGYHGPLQPRGFIWPPLSCECQWRVSERKDWRACHGRCLAPWPRVLARNHARSPEHSLWPPPQNHRKKIKCVCSSSPVEEPVVWPRVKSVALSCRGVESRAAGTCDPPHSLAHTKQNCPK